MYRNETAQGLACTETEQQNKGQKAFKKPRTCINTGVPDFSMVKSAVPKLYKGRPVSVHLLYYIAMPVGWMEHTTRRPTLSTRGIHREPTTWTPPEGQGTATRESSHIKGADSDCGNEPHRQRQSPFNGVTNRSPIPREYRSKVEPVGGKSPIMGA